MTLRWNIAELKPLLFGFMGGVLLLSTAKAQDAHGSDTGARSEWMEQQQKDKAQTLIPAMPPRAEHVLEKYIGDDPLNKYLGGLPGLRLNLGGLPSGGGPSVGPGYYRPDFAEGKMHFRAFAAGSAKRWYLIETELQFPNIAGRYLDIGVLGRRLDANSMDYYGPGAQSRKSSRTNYRREENELRLSFAFKPTRRFINIGFTSGYLWLNTGPGQAGEISSSEKQYSPRTTPGIDRQTDYFKAGVNLDVDSRDKPKDPHQGTHFRIELSQFNDRKYDHYSFRQISGSIEQYFPFLNRKRVIALRACSILSYPMRDSEVPFYMQPTLGGSSSLRGYPRYRFHDNNSVVLNAEYRWEIMTLLDAAVFADAGKVFHQDGGFNFHDFESDAGFGLRFKSRESVVLRVETAFSQEGYGIWIAFDHVF